jgi:hypothetical protein
MSRPGLPGKTAQRHRLSAEHARPATPSRAEPKPLAISSRTRLLTDVPVVRQAGRLNLPRYFITWSSHVQACVQGWPSHNSGMFPAVDHDRSRT